MRSAILWLIAALALWAGLSARPARAAHTDSPLSEEEALKIGIDGPVPPRFSRQGGTPTVGTHRRWKTYSLVVGTTLSAGSAGR